MPTAIKATYSDWKLVKTRGVVQIVFEVPLAEADSAYELLGGMPITANERWFGIAAIKQEAAAKPRQDAPQHSRPDGAKRMDWRNMQPAAQAPGLHSLASVLHLRRDRYGSRSRPYSVTRKRQAAYRHGREA
jgi:hypothetical protein